MERKRTPAEVEPAVLIDSARRCPLCFRLFGDLSEKRGQIAHLDQNPTNCAGDNLAWICLDHHTLYDSSNSVHKNYTINEVKAMRQLLYDAIRQNKHAVSSAMGTAVPESEFERKRRQILLWKDKTIRHEHMSRTPGEVSMIGPSKGGSYVELIDCTESYVTIERRGTDGYKRSIPLLNIEISHDNTRDCLELQER